ncbi:MAG: PfkB family carbohydrate kinase [Phycisphaerales bacterium]|jgi:sugar/nucleoside kinase (ribokinase family)
MNPRTKVAELAAAGLEVAASRGMPAAFVGFDGFIDTITRLVDTRHGMGPAEYVPITTIEAFAARCAAAAGKSTNIERVPVEDRFGGNGPLMASALAALGAPTTFVGAIGREGSPREIHPVFATFAGRCREARAICTPSHTMCLEFDDGKLMLNETGNVQGVTWGGIVDAVGLDWLVTKCGDAKLLGIVNWSLLGGVEGIWRGLIRDIAPRVVALGGRLPRMFVDLSDPAKRTDSDITAVLELLQELTRAGFGVSLGLNLSEAQRLDRVVGTREEAKLGRAGAAIGDAAAALREAVGLDCVVIHPREGAGAGTANQASWFDGPLAKKPRLSTGAGDHFNAGFALAHVLGLPLDQCLAIGCATSGAYVRDAASPGLPRVAGLLRNLAEP